MALPNPKLALFAQFALVARSLSNIHRLELLEQLAQGERSVETLAERTNQSVANASQHLQRLRHAGVIASRREGKFVFYSLVDLAVIDLISALRRIVEQNSAEAERVIRSYFQNRDSLEAISREQLLEKLSDGNVTVLDVRPNDEFLLGHVPRAINIPFKQLKSRLSELRPGEQIIAYCRGPYCVLSYEAVALLRKIGFDAHRLEDGLPEWRAAGLPIESGPQP